MVICMGFSVHVLNLFGIQATLVYTLIAGDTNSKVSYKFPSFQKRCQCQFTMMCIDTEDSLLFASLLLILTASKRNSYGFAVLSTLRIFYYLGIRKKFQPQKQST
uniref:Transmembrane domain-containing protein n=1 Tax=Spironucleus salmonicida TaxID=348837 RepID=V6LMG4_9EUKA|eukprot:EST45408.1 Transmembrane domain-containing protein [Spironucleus salmonicida]